MCNPLETSIIIIISCLRCLSLLTAWPPEYRITEWIYLLRLSGCCPIPALSVANPTTTRRSNLGKISTRVQSSLIFLSGVYCRFIYTSFSSSVSESDPATLGNGELKLCGELCVELVHCVQQLEEESVAGAVAGQLHFAIHCICE